MSRTTELEGLERRLQRAQGPAARLDALACCDSEAEARLAAVRQALTPPRGHRSPARLAKGIMTFRMEGRNAPYPEIKYACYGLARPMDWEGRILLSEAALLEQLLDAVKSFQDRPRRFSECYRGLLAAWLQDLQDEAAAMAALEPGAIRLRRFLEDTGRTLANLPRRPPWVEVVLRSGLVEASALKVALGI